MDQRVDLARSEPFPLGPHTVTPATLELVTAHGRKVLERRVMQVLVRLACFGGEVVAREDLLAHCWAGRVVGEDVLYRAIRILRKLGEDVGGFAIETVGGVGYRLLAVDEPVAAPPTPSMERTIAVLPFANLSPDPEQEYFADGLAEELIGQLARVVGLKVICRTAAFAYRAGRHDLRDIGKGLGVSHVLEGSVRRAGERLRISARLADCERGFDLWSRTFDRQVGDVFAVQDEIAAAVASALSTALGVDSATPYGGTSSFDAYDHFLKAGRIWHHLSSQELPSRETHLRRAVAIDPDYGLAWATLACLLSHRRGFLPPAEHERVERERHHAARRALDLAPHLAESQIALACIEADKRNWSAAYESCVRAVPAPSGLNPQAELIVGSYFCVVGYVRAGVPYRLNARDFDPLSTGYACALLFSYHTLERWDDFDTEYERSRELVGPRDDIEALRLLRLLVTGAGDNVIADQYDRLRGADPLFGQLASVHGSSDRVRAILQDAYDSPPWRLYRVAQLAGAYNHPDIALAALARGVPNAPSWMHQLLWFPEFKAVRLAPAFKAIVRDAGLAQFWRETGNWPDCCRPLGQDDLEFY